MVNLVDTLRRLKSAKVMLIGDFMLDTYTIGRVKRISPEAPVSVLQVEREERRAGGAGNTVLNLLSLGSQVVVVGRVGKDSAGEFLRDSLQEEGADISGLLFEEGYQTPIKNRIIADNQQMMRVDYEKAIAIQTDFENHIFERISHLLDDIQVIAISDYGKGFLSRPLLANIIESAKKRKIPVIVDPKGIDFSKYKGASIIKPNLSEAILASKLGPSESLEKIASSLIDETNVDAFFITRSEAGISIFNRQGTREDFPVVMREVKDVTGAGDTVLAMITVAIANGFSYQESAKLANIAAGIAIEHFGCARVSLAEVATRLLENDPLGKVFDEEHLFALLTMVKDRPFTLLSIEGHLGLTPSLFKSIRKISTDHKGKLVIYLRTDPVDDEFLNLLSSLHEIDFIIIQKDSLDSLLGKISPTHIYLLANGSLDQVDHKQLV